MNTPIHYGSHGKYIEVFGVQSESNPDKTYTVARTALDVWSCSCPRWTLNASRPQCKHITLVKAFKVKNVRAIELVPTVVMPESVKKSLSRFAAIEL
jgi:hypothetical protein